MRKDEALRAAVRQQLFELKDPGYKDFIARLIPTMDRGRIIGVRTPALKDLARSFPFDAAPERYLELLPHQYYEENNLHAFLIGRLKGYDHCLKYTRSFLPRLDNWATCDSFRPKALMRQPHDYLQELLEWLQDERSYVKRFAIVNLMGRYLDKHFEPRLLQLVSSIDSEEYYIQMAVAWYLSEALLKQYELTLPLIEQGRLSHFVHNKAIQKAVESRQISDEKKAALKALRRARS